MSSGWPQEFLEFFFIATAELTTRVSRVVFISLIHGMKSVADDFPGDSVFRSVTDRLEVTFDLLS